MHLILPISVILSYKKEKTHYQDAWIWKPQVMLSHERKMKLPYY
jgi:hypothetical protein